MLYIRQILIMLAGLYTVRIKLEILGIEDYGIYNVVGGVIVMFSFLNTAMTSATQRFLNIAMGQNDTEQARNVYSISLIIYILIAVFVIILGETIGLWFVYNVLNIPAERHNAAMIVYQFTIFTAVIHILQVPYKATIIAYEKMSFFALFSIVEVILNLSIILLLPIFLYDKLIVYAFLISCLGFIIFIIHKIYCNNKFEIARFRFFKDKQLFKELFSFSGWSIFGSIANVCRNKGINILVNIFHGVTINAAMGIAMQINAIVYTFVSNFQTAFRPQIVKLYAAKENSEFIKLIFRSSKVSYYLLFFIVLPLYLNADFILSVWLKNVPDYTITFTRLILLYSLVDAIAAPLWMAIQATGNIKKYQIIISSLVCANIPLSLIFLYLGFSPVWVLIIKLVLNVASFIWRLFYIKENVKISAIDFFREVLIPIFFITVISCLIIYFFSILFINWIKLLLSCIASSLCIGILIYFIGINSSEKLLLKNFINKKINRKYLYE